MYSVFMPNSSTTNRLTALDAMVRAGRRAEEVAKLVTSLDKEAALAALAALLEISEVDARQVYSSPLRMFAPENIARMESEASELRQ